MDLGFHRTFQRSVLEASLERDLGLGSLERVELLARLERTFAVRFPDRLVAEAETPADLVKAIQSCIAASLGEPPIEGPLFKEFPC